MYNEGESKIGWTTKQQIFGPQIVQNKTDF
jgi:hypothetical protein